MTKTSLILGLRLVAGSLEVVDGVVAQCMKEGGIIVIDEAAHTTHELLLMLNSVLDRTSVTSVGDTIVYAEESFRVVLCANDSSYAGNVRLPQSFAQRLVALAFDYPGFDNELAITHAIAEAECRSPLTVPDSVARHVVATMRLVRTGAYPLSARNAAIILVLLNLAERKATSELDPYFTDPDTAEAKRRAAAVRVLGKGDEDLEVGDLRAPAVEEFLAFVSAVGVQRFREAFLAGSMYHLDVDGLELDEQAVRSAIAGQIL
jgi:MoxR-like ATPase